MIKRASTLLAFFLLLFLAACGVDEPAPSATNGGGDTAVSPISFTAAQSVAEAASLRDHDHTHGAADPVVTIIEYGDFQ